LSPEDEKTSTIDQELETAQQDLHQTMSMVETKIGQELERAEDSFSPRNLLRDNMVGAAGVAGVLGYLVGSSKYRRMVGPALLVATGYAIWNWLTTQESSNEGVSV
jgi:hypothetical protein